MWGGEGGETARILILFIYFMPLTLIKWITGWGKSTGKQQSEHLSRGNIMTTGRIRNQKGE